MLAHKTNILDMGELGPGRRIISDAKLRQTGELSGQESPDGFGYDHEEDKSPESLARAIAYGSLEAVGDGSSASFENMKQTLEFALAEADRVLRSEKLTDEPEKVVARVQKEIEPRLAETAFINAYYTFDIGEQFDLSDPVDFLAAAQLLAQKTGLEDDYIRSNLMHIRSAEVRDRAKSRALRNERDRKWTAEGVTKELSNVQHGITDLSDVRDVVSSVFWGGAESRTKKLGKNIQRLVRIKEEIDKNHSDDEEAKSAYDYLLRKIISEGSVADFAKYSDGQLVDNNYPSFDKFFRDAESSGLPTKETARIALRIMDEHVVRLMKWKTKHFYPPCVKYLEAAKSVVSEDGELLMRCLFLHLALLPCKDNKNLSRLERKVKGATTYWHNEYGGKEIINECNERLGRLVRESIHDRFIEGNNVPEISFHDVTDLPLLRDLSIGWRERIAIFLDDAMPKTARGQWKKEREKILS